LRRLPVIMMSALGSEADRAIGLDLGADDYLSKPFGPLELAARIRAVLRRRGEPPVAVSIVHGALTLDSQNRTVRLGKKALELQPREFDVLFLLVKNPHRLLTRDVLHESTSPTGAETSARSLDTHIKNLRKKLGTLGRWIVTVPKMGYRFDPDDK
jgi:two-component system alkaline phosphatase synthesis response regulator PhoP